MVWSSHLSPGGCLVLFSLWSTDQPSRPLAMPLCVCHFCSHGLRTEQCARPRTLDGCVSCSWLRPSSLSSCLISTRQCMSCGGCLPALGCVSMGIGEQTQFCFSWFVCPSVFSLPFVFLGGSRLLTTILWQHGGRGEFRSFWACTVGTWTSSKLPVLPVSFCMYGPWRCHRVEHTRRTFCSYSPGLYLTFGPQISP